MVTINMESIIAKAKRFMETDEGKKKLKIAKSKKTNNGGGLEKAAQIFIQILQDQIKSREGRTPSSGGLGVTAVSALFGLKYGSTKSTGENIYQIEVSFTNDLHRDSLVSDQYSGVDNIASLLNSGYSSNKRVYGVWKNHTSERMPSLLNREGSKFIEDAIRIFMDGYAKKYGIIDIVVDDIYK